MKASKEIKRQMFVEIFALLVLIGAVIYALCTLKSSDNNKLVNYDGVVTVLDDSKFKDLKISSDGVGLNTDGITYTVTNNRSETIDYELVILPDVHDDNVLKNIRVGLDDIYLYDLNKLSRGSGGYVVSKSELDPGYTTIYSLKLWYKNSSDPKSVDTDVSFDYKLNIK